MAELVYIFSGNEESDFPSPSEGQMALQINTGQLWAYMQGNWQPITGGKPFDIDIPFSVFINGYNRDLKIKNASLKIKNNITSTVDTASFILLDDGDILIKPNLGNQVDIFSYSSNSKIFSGEIMTIDQYLEFDIVHDTTYLFAYKISCSDFTKRLEKRLIVEEYTNKTAEYILKDIIDKYFVEFSYVNIEAGTPTIDYVQFNYVTALNAIKKIAKLTGYDWYVDAQKDLHFFLPSINYAPYDLTEDVLTSGHYMGLNFKRDKTNYRNKIILQGGYYLEAFNDDIQIADGEQTTFNLAFEPYSPVAVYVDTGSGYVQKTLGIDNIDTSGYDFVVNQSEKCIRNLDLAVLNSGDKVKVTYNKKIKIIVTDEDTTSQSDIQSREGGDGVYEHKLNDDTIGSLDAAYERIDAEISDYKDPLISGSFTTDQPGYEAGQILRVNLPNWGYENQEYKIQSVTINPRYPRGDDNRAMVKYSVNFQSFERNFDQFLLSVYNNSTNKEIIVKGDEVLF